MTISFKPLRSAAMILLALAPAGYVGAASFSLKNNYVINSEGAKGAVAIEAGEAGLDRNGQWAVKRWYGKQKVHAGGEITWKDAVVGVIRVYGESREDGDPTGRFEVPLCTRFVKDMRGYRGNLGISQNWNFEVRPDGTVDTRSGWNP